MTKLLKSASKHSPDHSSSSCRVLLFSTMTKLLDLLQEYLKWRTLPDGRKMKFR